MERRTPSWRGLLRLAGDFLTVSPKRQEGIERLARKMRAGRSIVLSTHINADGDGCGSEIALALFLMQWGASVTIVNPTPWPETFRFLLTDQVRVIDARANG